MGRNECRACLAEMLWVTMQSGRPNPLDAEPVRELDGSDPKRTLIGLVAVPEEPSTSAWVVSQHTTVGELAGHSLHTSHFATCPYADRFAKKAEPVGKERDDVAHH